MLIEVTLKGTSAERLPVAVDKVPDVITLGSGEIFVLVGKPLDGRKEHYTYRSAVVHSLAHIFSAE